MKTLAKLLVAFSCIVLVSCSPQQSADITDVEKTEIQNMMKAYRQAWMDADSAQVLNKLSNEVRMMRPGDDATPIVGKKALGDFWFPPSDISYPIFKYEISNEEIQGSGDLAFLQGTSRLGWCILENGIYSDSTTNISEYLTVLRKEDGDWKIYRQIYNMKAEGYSR